MAITLVGSLLLLIEMLFGRFVFARMLLQVGICGVIRLRMMRFVAKSKGRDAELRQKQTAGNDELSHGPNVARASVP